LQQVIWNLVNNASKFTPKGGRIDVRLERRADSQVEVSVSDTGQGIEPELLPHLFERFRQGDVSSKRNSGGLGLGLAIVKHIVEMHGGTVTASSAGAGQGAKFVVLLPIAAALDDSPPANAHRDLGPIVEVARLDGVRILIVDDDADTCAVMSRILNETGALVTTANSVDDALTELEKSTPHVLVSDIGMAERDGYDLIREVRARGLTYQTLPAIALTALASPQDRRRALLAGYQVHVAKPVDAGELTAAIAALIGRIQHG
jgi:CheY-like chemotaxis protein